MNMAVFWLFGALTLNSLIGLVGVFSLFVKPQLLKKAVKILIAFSAGVLLGGGLFHLLAEALVKLDVNISFAILSVGFVVFFALEEYFHWHSCEECEVHPYSYLITIGDSVHNFIDGLVLAGTFMINVPLGVITSVLVLGHEIPQELGVFAVQISGGIEKKRAILYSFFAQCSCIAGGILGVALISYSQILAQYMLPFAAGGFIYIAASDLIPEIHKVEGRDKIISFLWLCIGLAFMMAVKILIRD